MRWPKIARSDVEEEFFLGVWNPDGVLDLDVDPHPGPGKPIRVEGTNWCVLTSRSPFNNRGLVHADSAGNAACFRGYLLDPPVHTWTPQLARALLDEFPSRPNGVFAMARVTTGGRVLELVSDAFGLGPLCFRRVGRTVLFATNPRFLPMHGDEPDMIAWRALLAAGSLFEDRTLSRDVRRVPPGSVLRFDAGGMTESAWFDYDSLPRGTRPIDDQAVLEVEAAFQLAMDRCLALADGDVFLPLSSGHDSRRVLAALVSRGVDFHSATVRCFQKERRDLDGRFAGQMARDLGFSHQMAELPPTPEAFAAHDAERRLLLDAESPEHTWALSLRSCMPARPALILDGTLGDILSETGYFYLFSRLNLPVVMTPDRGEAERHNLQGIVRLAVGDHFDRVLRADAWPSADEVRSEIRQWLVRFPPAHQADLAYVLTATRRSIAIWAQHLFPAGHVAVLPYADLDYVQLTLDLDASMRIRYPLQATCLERFWPSFFSYPGSRTIPADLPPGPANRETAREIAVHRRLEEELREAGGLGALKEYVNPRYRVQAAAARRSGPIAARSSWWLTALLAPLVRLLRLRPVWSVEETGGESLLVRTTRPERASTTSIASGRF